MWLKKKKNFFLLEKLKADKRNRRLNMLFFTESEERERQEKKRRNFKFDLFEENFCEVLPLFMRKRFFFLSIFKLLSRSHSFFFSHLSWFSLFAFPPSFAFKYMIELVSTFALIFTVVMMKEKVWNNFLNFHLTKSW